MNIVSDLQNKPADWGKDMACISSVLAAQEHNVTLEKAVFPSQNILFINSEMKTTHSWNIVGRDVALYILKFASSMRTVVYWYVQIWIHNLPHIKIRSFASNMASNIMILWVIYWGQTVS